MEIIRAMTMPRVQILMVRMNAIVTQASREMEAIALVCIFH